MDNRLKVSLLETEHFAGDRTGNYVKGYEPALVNLDGRVVQTRFIDPERLSKAESLTTALFTIELPYGEQRIDFRDFQDEGAREWMRKFDRLHGEDFGEVVPPLMHINPLDFPEELQLRYLPNDYFNRPQRYPGPEGSLLRLPSTMEYCRMVPSMRFSDGRAMPHINYSKRALSRGSEWSFSSHNPSEPEHFNSDGVLLGNLHGTQVEFQRGDWSEIEFPIKHYLDVIYMVRISDRKHNPLIIRTELVLEE